MLHAGEDTWASLLRVVADDNQMVDEARGTVHAFDAMTGAPKWSFDPVQGQNLRAGASNVWAPISVDEARGLVYLPTSSPSPDFWGGYRTGDSKYSNAVVAVKIESGTVAWSFQTSLVATGNRATACPLPVKRTSGSFPRLPISSTLFTDIAAPSGPGAHLGAGGRRFLLGLGADARAQRIHKIDHICGLAPLRPLYRLAFLLLFKQIFESILVAVFKLCWIEVPRFRVHDMRCEFEHVFGNFLIGDLVKIVIGLANLVRISQGDPKKTFFARFQRNDVFARCEDNLSDGYHAFLANCFADHGKCLLSDFAVRNDIIRTIEVESRLSRSSARTHLCL
jgi:hypothetical protein